AFEDLDEIIARHIQPMASFARDLLNFRYFVNADGGKKEEMEKILLEEKKKAANKIHYYVSASRQYPGKFLLSYLPRIKVRHEFITATPEGLRYRNKIFRSVNSLFRWFKEHFRDPVPGTPSMSVRTPMGQSSYIGNTPSINLATLDPQAIQRAAANLPSHVFNALSQVAGQTPGAFQGANAFAPGYSGGYNYQPYTPSQPVATPMAITPSYHAVPTPAHSQVPTPRYSQTPQQNWTHPAVQTPSRSTP
ncbi:transcription elongation factor SPT6, partial [Nephila pilipes]